MVEVVDLLLGARSLGVLLALSESLLFGIDQAAL